MTTPSLRKAERFLKNAKPDFTWGQYRDLIYHTLIEEELAELAAYAYGCMETMNIRMEQIKAGLKAK